jgi:hypothetical protein
MPKKIDAIIKFYDYLLWMIPKLERFPRSQKSILGDRIGFDKPVNILTADTRRQSADKSLMPFRQKSGSIRAAIAVFAAARLFRAKSRGLRRQKICVCSRLSNEQSERAVH